MSFLFYTCAQNPATARPRVGETVERSGIRSLSSLTLTEPALSSSRVWCAPAGPARTARREPARPSRACWRAVACTSPSTRRNALCRLCVVTHGLGWRGWPAGTETPTHCGWPRLAKAWRPPCACSGASGAGGRVSWPPPRAAGSPPRFPAKVCHKAGRRHGASTRCRERSHARPRTRAPRSARAAPRRW